jgi:hypothetical protein
MDLSQHVQTSLLALAGNARLPPKILIKENKLNENDSLISMEHAIQEYIKSKGNFNKLLHNEKEKQIILNDIINIIKNFDISIMSSYIKLWESFITGKCDEKELKPIVEQIINKINNKKAKAQLIGLIRTKLSNCIKTILNITPPFVSMFQFDTLSKAEQVIQDNIQRLNVNHMTNLDTFLDVFNFVNDEDLAIKQFHNEISQITSPQLRNEYYNKLLSIISNKLTTKVGKETRLSVNNSPIIEHIFVQIYLYLTNMETIKKVDENVEQYLKLKSFNWFSYQINEFSNKLHPNWNFKAKGFTLDSWQKETINAIDNKKNIFLSLPTSGGKTLLSTYAIRTHQRVCYLVPSEALAYQLTGIILASLNDIEKSGESPRNVRQETANFSFKKFPEHSDDIIIATPIEFYNLLKDKNINPAFDYIIFDEFHNITDNKLGIYIEYILMFAAYFSIPFMCLSATIPNYTEVKLWLKKITGNDIFAVNEKKRFFNQTRMMVKNNKCVVINPLEHITNETLKKSDFTHIGLYPKEIISLYHRVSSYTNSKLDPINEKLASLVTLDKLDQMERNIFSSLKSYSDKDLEELFNQDSLKSDELNSIDSLSTFKLFKILKECKTNKMTPMLIFKMDSQKCLDIYYKMITMLRHYQNLVFGDFYMVNKIIQSFFDTFEQSKKKIEPNLEKNITLEDAEQKLKDSIYGSEGGIKDQLEEYFHNYIKTVIDPDDIKRFNDAYGADITSEEITMMRKKHASKEMRTFNSPETMHLRNMYTPHSECRLIDSGASYDDMKKIRRRINSEINRENRLKTDVTQHIAKINYSHPFMVGIEYGFICYNTLLSPALQRACQQLIIEHPFITFTDSSLAVGINYPIKSVMLLGGIDGEPLEDIDNTLAHQACGRAGRRGLDAEGYIIYAGVNIKNILIPSYTPITRNSIMKLASLFCEHDSNEFKDFVANENVPTNKETLWQPLSVIDFDKIANEIYLLQSTNKVNEQQFIEDNDQDYIKKTSSNDFKTIEEIKTELINRCTMKIKTKTIHISQNMNNYEEINITHVKNNEDINIEDIKSKHVVLDSWEDDEEYTTNTNDIFTNKIKNAESSFM